jgi:hypothetical protein
MIHEEGPWELYAANNNGGVYGQREPWRLCRPAVADSCPFDEKQDPDPQLSEKLNLGTALKRSGSAV